MATKRTNQRTPQQIERDKQIRAQYQGRPSLADLQRSGRNAVRMGLHLHATQQPVQPRVASDGSRSAPRHRSLGESTRPSPHPSPRH